MIRLLIAARSPVVRAGLESLAASDPGVQVIGTYPDLSAVEELRPDLVLASLPTDYLLSSSEGLDPAASSLTPIVLLSPDPAPVWTHDTLRAGVRALLPSSASPAEILGAVMAVAAGLAAIDPQDLDGLLTTAGRSSQAAGVQPLTPRELEVLRMLADGAANKTIAWKLDISEHTAKFHVASIMAKLGANTRTEAVTTGIRQGLILI